MMDTRLHRTAASDRSAVISSTVGVSCEGAPRRFTGARRHHIFGTMALLKIARMGHPVLRAVAAPVDDPTAPWVRRLVEDMIETMEDAGGTGIAAPQVHESHRLVLFRVPEERVTEMPGDSAQDLTVLVNPVVELLGQERALGWEGCLSVPGLRGVVPRHLRVRYRGLGLDGERIDREVEGFHARVVQHECDHLDGILYPQRMTDHRLLVFLEELQRHPIDLAAFLSERRAT